jgi:hypothetical protein
MPIDFRIVTDVPRAPDVLDGTVERAWVDAQLKARGFSG